MRNVKVCSVKKYKKYSCIEAHVIILEQNYLLKERHLNTSPDQEHTVSTLPDSDGISNSIRVYMTCSLLYAAFSMLNQCVNLTPPAHHNLDLCMPIT